MPRSILTFGGGRFVKDDIDDDKFVVVGALNKDPLKPLHYDLPLSDLRKPPKEEQDLALENIRVFKRDETSGRFAEKALRWTTDIASAQVAMEAFATQREGDGAKWINLRILPVSSTITNA